MGTEFDQEGLGSTPFWLLSSGCEDVQSAAPVLGVPVAGPVSIAGQREVPVNSFQSLTEGLGCPDTASTKSLRPQALLWS